MITIQENAYKPRVGAPRTSNSKKAIQCREARKREREALRASVRRLPVAGFEFVPHQVHSDKFAFPGGLVLSANDVIKSVQIWKNRGLI